MTNLSKLNKESIGQWVVYLKDGERKEGRIKSWNDKFIFVVYNCDNIWSHFEDYTAEATRPEDLEVL